ncbi:MAG: chemotaxis protein [Cyanobium sp. CACIAM 14]|nr:MAG: chemotaxis protein [Cyanobium sp. CACIAM 14]
MAPASVSFRITRNAEDLAETIHALSQRLVTLEQRLAAVELQASRQAQPEPEELASLDNVERLLQDCRHLLEIDVAPAEPAPVDALGHGGYSAAA